ncbi:hypothetical protein Sango_2525500 [Sesamum angolense]|uniref:Uncharacterized protein n=1 Tax=Sesamum angolense TaxID=2727404 RepID=A0AAE1W4I2_9LAMI|nr:hypothetical protein Sango_2525500 [Sesamum angolense]
MRNAMRCISCILHAGDVIRIVHGRVVEISGSVKAAEIMKLHPKHVLKKPSSPSAKTRGNITVANLLISDRYLSEILSERISTQKDRRRGRVGVWRPHLESISETPVEA